jgi:RimJ/RimL family protein N-acetyltransferase
MNEPFTFRLLTLEDLPLLHEWLNRPHVAEWWEGAVSLEYVRESFTGDLDNPFIDPMLACLDGEPVGYVQVYRVLGADPEWWQSETDPGARGIDQFLANAEQLNRGLGSRMVREFVARIFADPAVTKIQTDPSPRNGRAIRAYEKAGFRRAALVDTPDGPAQLMLIERAEQEPRG